MIETIIFVICIGSSSALSTSTPLGNRDSCSEEKNFNFSWEDYLVLGIVLVISCGVGVFYGCFKKNGSSNDFLLGGSSMGTIPMSISLAASFITAIELLGNPAEMYTHGSQFWMICISFLLVVPLTSKFFLPVFLKLRLTSSYEYLSLRFSRKIRLLASGLYILQMVLYTSVAVYAPAVALSKASGQLVGIDKLTYAIFFFFLATGINVYLGVTAVYVVCVFYASQGGMKAVIIADTFQAAVLLASLLFIVVIGHRFVGGTGIIWSQSYNTGRLEIFNLDPDMTVRHSFWSVVIGGTFYWMTMFCSNQASIQKYLSVDNINQARKAIWTSSIGLIIIYSINFYTGMILVAHYKDCDPLRSKKISAADEILPYYIINVMGYMKGVTGFFVAGIFAASLGTVASALNSLAAVTMEDFIDSAFNKKIPESKGALVAKLLSVAYGALSFALVFVIANSGSIMQIAISFNGMVGGVTFGLFSLGMLFPWANSKGALVGSIFGALLITIMCIGQQIAIASGQLEEETKPTSLQRCFCSNVTEMLSNSFLERNRIAVFPLFRISYIWYSAIGFLSTVILGLITSLLTNPTRIEDIQDAYISPPVKNFLYSMSDGWKTFLNIPLQQECVKDSLLSETTIKINEEFQEFKQNHFNEQITKKLKKISAPV